MKCNLLLPAHKIAALQLKVTVRDNPLEHATSAVRMGVCSLISEKPFDMSPPCGNSPFTAPRTKKSRSRTFGPDTVELILKL